MQGRSIEPFLDRVASELPLENDIPEGVLESGLAQLDSRDRRAVVETWSNPYADRWDSLVTAAGDVEAAERALVLGGSALASPSGSRHLARS